MTQLPRMEGASHLSTEARIRLAAVIAAHFASREMKQGLGRRIGADRWARNALSRHRRVRLEKHEQ